jgi:pre-rRNA-processing protein TSR4
MWQDGNDLNENGEQVKLFQPASRAVRRNNLDLLDSHIGGLAAGEHDAPTCAKCEDTMYLLVQLHQSNLKKDDGSAVDRTLCVFGCPRANCFKTMTFEKGFSSGGQGIMCCRRIETPASTSKSAPVSVAPIKSAWYSEDSKDDDAGGDDWGDDTDEGADDLENAVAAMELKAEQGDAQPKKASSKPVGPKKSTPNTKSLDAFDCFALMETTEPIAARPQMEEDDVGLSASDDKIRKMLARYMAEEEDPEILNALKGVTGGGGGGEEDERLSPEDRVMLGFQDRIKRAPRQVVRRAREGRPLWSIPAEPSQWKVEPCVCGAQRVFECQILPSILHTLEVEKYSGAATKPAGISDLMADGMNWGSVAVYSCPNACAASQEEYLVVQESADGQPEIPRGQQAPMPMSVEAVVEDMDDDDQYEPFEG